MESLILRFVTDRHQLGVQIFWKDIWDYATVLVERMHLPRGTGISRKCLRRFLRKNGFKKLSSCSSAIKQKEHKSAESRVRDPYSGHVRNFDNKLACMRRCNSNKVFCWNHASVRRVCS
ncbi:hypothetical protein IscW_ISCW017923 [Ixodes scapularis]|uniref:Uncharacterized protein n=1 Tax=Ixodes scapularis TaxID=6945 RepID=B7PHZ8_IXOSC|nr:hypothetical protein IscW_ISCW017923 [Ixodes scapularis]|eukprot:XP_002404009.1 hypothetical protein IscW_ISCW017923 [Ixodes scapularis]